MVSDTFYQSSVDQFKLKEFFGILFRKFGGDRQIFQYILWRVFTSKAIFLYQNFEKRKISVFTSYH